MWSSYLAHVKSSACQTLVRASTWILAPAAAAILESEADPNLTSEKVLGEIYARTFELGLHLVILHRCYVPFCDHVWTWTGWNSGRTKPRKKGNDMILSYPRSKIATDPNCSFMLIRLFIKMPKRMRTGWVWNSGANCNGRLAVNCQAIAKGSDMRWFVYLYIIFPVKDWHRKKKPCYE